MNAIRRGEKKYETKYTKKRGMNRRQQVLLGMIASVGILLFLCIGGLFAYDTAKVTDFSRVNLAPSMSHLLGIKEDWMNRFPSELSGGELQRFCLARALGKRTRFLLADEISTMLDLITQSQIWNFLIKEVETRGIGLIVVSHNRSLLDQICTRQVQLEKNNSC